MKFTGCLLAALAVLSGAPVRAEQPVAPYAQRDSNAGALPLAGDEMFKALHGRDGLDRIVAALIAEGHNDPRIKDIFAATDDERLHRTLVEQLCYLTGGPCHYSGRSMAEAHRHMGLQVKDFDILVEHLEDAMTKEGVPWRVQAKLLGKLAAMKPQVVDASRN